eukprot:gnl/Hemi2/12527_TR4271_c0_g1_i1.p1 gnl/Hemi2/12527_TR4271_c0_g1~~gnl/Hemi2/12527_TR4271_c0_g1_i1.p1  ORF type:complete len:282 (-),score=83.76 gnl/Hemi2/12527_TR4271_c0_g1_i1:82-927(-)
MSSLLVPPLTASNFLTYHTEFDVSTSVPLLENPAFLFGVPAVVIALYLLMVFVGPALVQTEMKWLQRPLQAWNLFLCLYSVITFFLWGSIELDFWREHGTFELICMPGRQLFRKGEMSAWLFFLFMISKFAELFDTFFLVFRKKPIIFLHWYHHVTVLLYCWMVMYVQLPVGNLFGVMNAGIHSVMYFYYFLDACGHRPSWGRFLTWAQTTQMFVGLFLSSLWAFWHLAGEACTLYRGEAWLVISATSVMYGSYLYLFAVLLKKKTSEARRPGGAKPSHAD